MDVGSLPKTATNPHYGSKYTTLTDVYEAIRPALGKWGLAVVQVLASDNGTPALRTTLIHTECDESVTDVTPLVLGKESLHAHGAAVTYMRRYALVTILGLDSDEDVDGGPPQTGGQTGANTPAESAQATSGGLDGGSPI